MGEFSLLNKPIVAIVGPRIPSNYAEEVLHMLFNYLAQYDIVTISWLAPGVDQIAHRLSLKYNIPTIAVLWWGIGHYLQKSDATLIDIIVDQGGLILSEFDNDQVPQSYTFPQRNRIIAGLADLVFLPEAGKKSGSLITVDFANMMHKPTYGTPQNIFAPNSQWLLEYIQSGKIKSVIDIDTMLYQHFSWRKKSISQSNQTLKNQDFSEQETNLLVCLSEVQEAEIWAIAYHLQTSIECVLPQLTLLEIKNAVHQPSPWVYKISWKIA